MTNSIHNIATRAFTTQSGEHLPAIVMGLNILDPSSMDSFIVEVTGHFRNQRMMSPPSTAHMTITVAGLVTSEQFRDYWRRQVATDQILRAFMSMMDAADVLHISGSELLDRCSLLPSTST